jgi:hypothetical protein
LYLSSHEAQALAREASRLAAEQLRHEAAALQFASLQGAAGLVPFGGLLPNLTGGSPALMWGAPPAVSLASFLRTREARGLDQVFEYLHLSFAGLFFLFVTRVSEPPLCRNLASNWHSRWPLR